MCVECVGALCGLACLFCLSWFSFSCCLHAGFSFSFFLFWDRRRVCVCGEPEAPSSPQGELLHSHRAATSLAVFFPFPSPSPRLHRCDGPCLSEQHTHLGAATCRRKLNRALSRILSAGAFEEELAGVGVDLHHSQLDVFLLPLGGDRMCDPEKTIGDLGSAS